MIIAQIFHQLVCQPLWRVSKLEDKYNRSCGGSILEKDDYPIVYDCNNRHRGGYFSSRCVFFWKSNETCELNASDIAANPHLRLRRSRFPVYRFTFHMEHHCTKPFMDAKNWPSRMRFPLGCSLKKITLRNSKCSSRSNPNGVHQGLAD